MSGLEQWSIERLRDSFSQRRNVRRPIAPAGQPTVGRAALASAFRRLRGFSISASKTKASAAFSARGGEAPTIRKSGCAGRA